MSFSTTFSGKFWLVSLVLVCFSLFFIGVFLVSTTTAEIDPDTIVGMWLFDEGNGNVAGDETGNGLDGELEGKPNWVNGKFGKALELDGGGAHIVIPDHENPTKAITVSIWVKSHTDTWNQHGWMVEKRNAYIIHPNQGTKNVSWPICNGGCWNKPGGWRDGEIGPKDITEWHMYTTTYDSKTGEWYIYIDGKEESSMDLTKNPIDLDSGPVYIGNDTCCAGRFADATVDEVVIFDVALEQADIESMVDGMHAALGIDPADKMTITWAEMKIHY